MKHLSEEEMIEQYYKADASAGRHLEQCAECAATYAELERDLAAMNFAAMPERDAAYGERVWRAIASSLPVYEARKRSWLGSGWIRGLSYAAACLLLLSCAFYAGRLWEHKQPHDTANNNPRALEPQPQLQQPQQQQPQQQKQPQPQPRIVVVVLSDHLDRSERLLVELKHADASSAELDSPLRDEARSLLQANRICRQKARKQDDPALNTALDHLDHLLAELANQQGELNAASLAHLQDEMNADGLLFEVRVLRSTLSDQQPSGIHRSHGGTL
jgi:hypothetical protein